MVEYFWEYDYKFGQFLQKVFPNTYKRKYSMSGNGIYNLILVQDKIYEIKLSQTTSMLSDNSTLTTDKLKNKIIQNIVDNMKNQPNINNGKLTFKLGTFTAKVEVVKKMKMPEQVEAKQPVTDLIVNSGKRLLQRESVGDTKKL